MYSILRSIAVIGFVGAVGYTGVTGAFFTDSESSVGNVFTAGTFTGISLDSIGHITNGQFIQSGWLAGQPYGKFFEFPTVVPGDSGVRHLSLHNDNTSESAYICFNTGTITTNTHNAGAEITALVWKDNNFSGTWNPSEPMLTQAPISIEDLTKIVFADSTTGTPLAAEGRSDIAVAWCAGTIVANADGNPSVLPGLSGSTITCDGTSMTTQGGSYVADMVVYAEQVTNNGSFTCASTGTALPDMLP